MFVWVAHVVLPIALLGVVLGTAPAATLAPGGAAALFWIAIAASGVFIPLSRLLPPRIAIADAGPDAAVLVRLVVGWALCETAATLAIVAFALTHDPRLVGAAVVDLMALVTLYPSVPRWESLAPRDAAGRVP
jgi:hypothetical protein